MRADNTQEVMLKQNHTVNEKQSGDTSVMMAVNKNEKEEVKLVTSADNYHKYSNKNVPVTDTIRPNSTNLLL